MQTKKVSSFNHHKKGESDLLTCSVSLVLIFGLGWFIVKGLSESDQSTQKHSSGPNITNDRATHHQLVDMEKQRKRQETRKIKKEIAKKTNRVTVLNAPVTVNGYDEATGEIINPLRVWRDYWDRNRGVVGKVAHGSKVTLLQKSGKGRKIRLADGTVGWISDWFLKE